MLLIPFKSLLSTSVHPRQRPNKQCVRFTQCSYFNRQTWADFTEWHHVVSKILSVQKVYCNTLWCFIIGGQFDLVNKSNQIQEQIKKKKNWFHFSFSYFIFYSLLSYKMKSYSDYYLLYYSCCHYQWKKCCNRNLARVSLNFLLFWS